MGESHPPLPRSRESIRIWHEASRAVAARGAGLDFQSVRVELERELARRGLEDVRPDDLDFLAKNIVDGRGRLGGLRLARNAWRQFAKAVAILKASTGPEWLRAPAGDDVEARRWRSVPVDVPAEAQAFLSRAFDALYEQDDQVDEEVACTVWIPADSPPVLERGPEVRVGSVTVGRLGVRDAPAFARAIEKARRRKRSLRLDGFIAKEGGGFLVSVNVPFE
jgi:hypothetical protein